MAPRAADSRNNSESMLVIRLGAMGDIIHTLPAVSSLKTSFPDHKISWLVSPRWAPLLEGNPAVDDLIFFEREGLSAIRNTWRRLRQKRFKVAFDFQGLLQSALAGGAAHADTLYGFSSAVARESHAAWFYDRAIDVVGPHRVERNLQLIAAAGASRLSERAWIPAGREDGRLPAGPFVLACPFAGWTGKEWPLEYYEPVARFLRREGLELVLNVPESQRNETAKLGEVNVHTSAIPGLIHATRRATAILGVDSGPLHLAAALDKPGVALFGPTDPALTGPYGSAFKVLRAPGVETTYKRHSQVHWSMRDISVQQVVSALTSVLENSAARSSAMHMDAESNPSS
ncbi:MAG: glycosyltransferase family 9 protein [Bryobacteraceae bacterium]